MEEKKGVSFITIAVMVFFGWTIWRLVARIGSLFERFGIPGWTAGIAIIVVVAALFLRWVKSALVKGMPRSFEPIATTPDWHSWLDRGELDRYTSAYEALGFQHLQDFTTKTEGATAMNGFARLWVHPEHKCLAEINQVMTAQGTKSPARSVVMSYFDQDWTLSTTDRKVEGTNWVLRRPKGIWSSHPEAPPQELLRIHLQTRDEFVRGMGVKINDDLSMEAYTRSQQEYQRQVNELIKRKFIVTTLLEILLFPKNPKSEWWGAYRKVVKKN